MNDSCLFRTEPINTSLLLQIRFTNKIFMATPSHINTIIRQLIL